MLQDIILKIGKHFCIIFANQTKNKFKEKIESGFPWIFRMASSTRVQSKKENL